MSKELIYKRGDVVRVISLQNEDNRGDCHIEVGDIGNIVSVYEDAFLPYFVCFEDGSSWYFDENNLQLMVEDNTTVNQDKQTGVKYDSDKPEYSLLPKGVLNSVVKVLGFGSKKYSKDNWQKVSNPKERYYNAAQRHIHQWWEGEKYDDETGENHLAHAICCLMFMLWFDNQENKESK